MEEAAQTLYDTGYTDAKALLVQGGMTEAQAEATLAPLATARNSIHQADARGFASTLGTIVEKFIPDEALPQFQKDFAGKPMETWFGGAVEAAAPTSKYVKQLEVKHAAAIEEAKATSFAAGAASPGGQATQRSTQSAARMTRSSFMAMTPDERAEAWRDHPEEVAALT